MKEHRILIWTHFEMRNDNKANSMTKTSFFHHEISPVIM